MCYELFLNYKMADLFRFLSSNLLSNNCKLHLISTVKIRRHTHILLVDYSVKILLKFLSTLLLKAKNLPLFVPTFSANKIYKICLRYI